jgi:hypothetical protein
MRTNRNLLFLLVTTFLIGSCFPNRKIADNKTIITPLYDTIPLMEGSIVYALPRTVFTIVVKMEKTIEKPGPYAAYASDLLGLDDVIKNYSEYWSIKDIAVNSHDEFDPSEFYVIKSNTLFQTNVLALKKEGLILDLNPNLVSSDANQIVRNENETNVFGSFDLGADEYFQVQRDTAFKRVSVDSVFIRIPYIVEKRKKLSTDQLAEKAAKRLMEMREGKHMILTGEATVFPQNEAAINEINALEKDYTELFSGKTWSETKIFTCQLIPEKDMAGKPLTLLQFSELTGPVTGSKKGGSPIVIEFKPEQKNKDLTIINKTEPGPDTDQNAPVYDKLFYRVPDVVNIKISLDSETLFNSRKLIYQFGEVIQLPANYLIGR